MSTTVPTQNLELAHVLFMDIVSYSTLPMDKQEECLGRLQEAIKNTADFQRAQARGELIVLPTGDGMALVFFGDPEAPVRCAVELCGFLRASPDIQLRMGIHTGPVYRITDINANLNVAGGGINMAQRVMDCGDASHILLSSTVAEVLQQLSRWKDALHDFGHVQVKHGTTIHVYNLFCDEAGNADVPARVRGLLPVPQQDSFVVSIRRLWIALVAPTKAFEGIERAPNWWTPWLVMSVLGVMLAVTVEYRVGFGPLLDNQLRRSAIAGRMLQQVPPEERTARIETAVTAERYASYGFPVLLLVGAMFVAAMVKFALKIFEKREIAFITSVAVVMYSLAPQVVRTTAGMVALLIRGSPVAFTVHDPLPTNLSYFIDFATNPFLMAGAQLADVFRLWTLVLCVIGFTRVTKARPVTIALVTTLSYGLVLLATASARSAFL